MISENKISSSEDGKKISLWERTMCLTQVPVSTAAVC